MEPNCLQFLENKTILVTGASGYLAKVFVERVLRLQPNVKRLYLLVRASDKESAEQRLRSEVFEKDLFKVIREKVGDEGLNSLISKKVVPVWGDISINNMGVSDSILLRDMMQEIDIVLHSAATTRFDDRYDVALGINTFGALNVLNFTKKCVKSQLLLHVSTAYVCGESSGLILEKPFAMGETLKENIKVDINAEMKLAKENLKQLVKQGCSKEEVNEAMKDLGLKRAKLYGWPNTYVFTKAMGEMLIGHNRESMPIAIIRPTIISSTLSDPFPGWVEGLKTIDSFTILYGKGMVKCFLGSHKTVFDVIPVDLVVNGMMAIAAEHLCDSSQSHTVYHVGSSYRNPVTYKQIHEFIVRYFEENPLLGRNGKPIVPKMTVLSTKASFHLYTALRFRQPLQLLRLLGITFPSLFGGKYEHHNRKFKMAMRLVKLYESYVLFKGIFDDRSMETLRIKTEAKEANKMFSYNPKCLDWDDYYMNTHLPGLVKYVLKK